MPTVIQLPQLIPTMETAKVLAWHKREGERVEKDELLAEIETDKATIEFRAQTSGTLLKVLVGVGNDVVVGEAVAIFGAVGEDISALEAKLKTKAALPQNVPVTLPLTEVLGATRCKFCNRKLPPNPQRTLCEHCGAPV